jgi:hypothetical protein
MRFHAVLEGVAGLERPIEIYGEHLDGLRHRAVQMLKAYPQGRVEIFEVSWTLKDTVMPEVVK